MHSTRAFHPFTHSSIATFLLLVAVVTLLAAGCGGEEPASPGGEARPQGTAESRPRESGPGTSSASTNTLEPTAQAPQQRSTAGAETPEATRRGQSGTTPGQTEQPAATTTAGGQSGGTAAQTEEPATTVAPEATMAPTATPAGPECPQRQPTPNVMLPAAQTSPETDKEALIALFNATNGESWDGSGTWLGRSPIGEWEGITTNDQGRVITLRIPNLYFRMPGVLPSELGNLTSLVSLEISGSGFDGNLPPELGNLANLQRLDLNNNKFSGCVPPELGNLANLQWLDLTGNELSGALPPELGNLANLQWLSLSDNELSGELPPELSNLANLQRLDLSNNEFSGQIPTELEDLFIKEETIFSGNNFSGCISDYFSDLMGIRGSDLERCDLPPDHPGDTATLIEVYEAWGSPDWSNWLGRNPIGAWQGVSVDSSGRVVALRLGLHQVTQKIEIPPMLGNLSSLRLLRITDGNYSLHGEIPPELGNLSNLQGLNLSYNDLSGEIPPELGNLSNLQGLNLSYTGLSGEIPPELGNLTNLQELNLSHTDLSGEIPPELGNLTYLQELNLSRNDLSGEIPPELGNLTNLQTLYLSGNYLSGCVAISYIADNDLRYARDIDFCP